MIELVATCYLASGIIFTVPEGWTAQQVGIHGSRMEISLYSLIYRPPIDRSYIILKRNIEVGQKVQAPENCTLEVETQK